MIRLIQRRLIIPRGDTGSFSIPALDGITEDDTIIFALFDPLTQKNVLKVKGSLNEGVVTITFQSKDTVNLQPRKYLWDIRVYHGLEQENEELYIGEETLVNSYYAAFKLPVCEIREAVTDVYRKMEDS